MAERAPAGSAQPDVPIGFGYKASWIAVPATDGASVCEALGLEQVERCTWRKGYRHIYAGYETYMVCGLFVTPLVDGWVMAAGALPEIADPKLRPLLERLSKRFGNAFYFGTHRVVGYQAWARATDGTLRRAFGFLGERGEFLIDFGEATPEESALDVGVQDVDQAPDEEDVLSLAAEWALDPRTLNGRTEPYGPGWFGRRPK